MLNLLKSCLLVVLLSSFTVLTASADAPRWVRKGVKSLNSQRSNDTYKFISLNTHDLDLEYLKDHATDALKTYVEENYSPKYGSIIIAQTTFDEHPEFTISYKDLEGNDNTIEAKRVDVYDEFDDFEENVYQFEYYQLYAVSEPNVTPVFDNYSHTRNYNGAALVKSIIPGMGQLDKGQVTKARVIIGGEILFVGAGLIFEYKRWHAKKEMDKGGYGYQSWNSKRQAWQNFEIGAFGCAAALYIYNLVDAAVSKGASQVVVKKASQPSYSFTPYANTDELGVSLVVNF